MERPKNDSSWLVLTAMIVIVIVIALLGMRIPDEGSNQSQTAVSAPTTNNSSDAQPASNNNSNDPATNLSEQTGVSLGDAQTIESITSSHFSNPDIQQAVATDAAKLDVAGAANATIVANDLSNIVQGWSFSNANDVSVAVNDLYTASQSSAYNFTDFSSIILQATPDLVASGMPFQSSVDTLASLSTQSGQTAQTAQQIYIAVAADMNPANTKGYDAILQIPGVAQDLKNKDFVGLLTDMEKYFGSNMP